MLLVGVVVGFGGGMMKGGIDYMFVVGKVVIVVMWVVFVFFGDYFLEGFDVGDMEVVLVIWVDCVGFDVEIVKFVVVFEKVMVVFGWFGLVDFDVFKVVFGFVLGSCKFCYEGFWVKN